MNTVFNYGICIFYGLTYYGPWLLDVGFVYTLNQYTFQYVINLWYIHVRWFRVFGTWLLEIGSVYIRLENFLGSFLYILKKLSRTKNVYAQVITVWKITMSSSLYCHPENACHYTHEVDICVVHTDHYTCKVTLHYAWDVSQNKKYHQCLF